MTYNRIVVGVDFSERSIAAAHWVGRVFAPRAELVLVHVLELPPPASFVRRRFPLRADEIETYRVGARARLRQLGQQVPGGPVCEEVRTGRPEEEVLRVARQQQADLIVVGSHREHPGFWNRFGSTAERILGGSDVPVLIVHGAPRETPRIVLAAIDDSATGRKVITHAQLHVERFGATGTVLYVLPPPPGQLLAAGELSAHIMERDEDVLEATAAWLAGRIAPNELRPLVQLGHTPEVILREARLSGADLLVLGRERTGNIRRYLLGSVTSSVIRAANCPVLVIPSASRDAARPVDRSTEPTSSDALVPSSP